ncbi:uncharacterized protein A4U43_C03F21230 [Asparagus officinalis]|uniref:Uncharacterized protein n=1 Tax=Asparagus officinalis TaxID=4686 RepID=A0A5P1FCM9_ASPOF|nr:uncharacterized protein A4U43_C03F21230 [Asparagus officinalis]
MTKQQLPELLLLLQTAAQRAVCNSSSSFELLLQSAAQRTAAAAVADISLGCCCCAVIRKRVQRKRKEGVVMTSQSPTQKKRGRGYDKPKWGKSGKESIAFTEDGLCVDPKDAQLFRYNDLLCNGPMQKGRPMLLNSWFRGRAKKLLV